MDHDGPRRGTERANVFVSFSVTGDQPARAFVRLLLARLAEQPGLCVWIYESPQGRIASGESIADQCRRHIDRCDAFVLLITDQALESDYVSMEVSHALWVRQQRPLKIYPLLATDKPQGDWPLAFQEAAGFRGRPTALLAERVDAIVWDLCIGLKAAFVPASEGDRRLPLRGRVIHELEQARSAHGFDIGDFERLLRRCDQAAGSLAAGNVSLAKRLAESMLLDCEADYGGFRPYYLAIFHAACALAEANEGRAAHAGAFDAFDQIVRDWGPRADANAFAGRGHVRLQLGEYHEALADYDVAERLLDRPDPALAYSQIRACILARRPVDADRLAQLEQMVRTGVVGQQLGDGSRVAAVVALAHAYSGRLADVQRAWASVTDAEDTDAGVVCEVCHWLERVSEAQPSQGAVALQLGVQILGQRLAVAGETAQRERLRLTHQLARTEFRLGRRAAADHRMSKLLDEYPKHVVLAVDAAMFALEQGERAEAARRCRQALAIVDRAQCDPPLDRASFEHAAGQAYWLLGRVAESRECHRRSGLPEAQWFGATMPQLFAAAAAVEGRPAASRTG